MSLIDVVAIISVLLTAVAVLPGTLGVLMLTNKIAASPAGARYIYSQSGALLAVALALIFYVGFRGYQEGGYSTLVLGSMVIVGFLLVYGFLMHAKLLFTPITEPSYVSIERALKTFSADEEVVGVIDKNGKPFAYIARLARRPHIVFQPDGDAPFIMTHCILAHSSMSYELQGNFSSPEITITAALANNMVFYEKSSRCSVVQIHNRLEQNDEPLSTLPTVMTSLVSWAKFFPNSPVWSRTITWRDIFYLKLLARADVIDPASPVMVYPLEHQLDERLPLKSCVIGVLEDDQARAYPVATVTQMGIINDRLSNRLIAVFCSSDFMQVYDRRISGGAALTFDCAEQAGEFVDRQSGSVWSATGVCVSGKYEGDQLKLIPHYNKIFWYVWSDYFPNGDIYVDSASNTAAA